MRFIRSMENIKTSISLIYDLRLILYSEEQKEQIKIIIKEIEKLKNMIR